MSRKKRVLSCKGGILGEDWRRPRRPIPQFSLSHFSGAPWQPLRAAEFIDTVGRRHRQMERDESPSPFYRPSSTGPKAIGKTVRATRPLLENTFRGKTRTGAARFANKSATTAPKLASLPPQVKYRYQKLGSLLSTWNVTSKGRRSLTCLFNQLL